MCGCESWTVKMAEGWRIDAFELWCWRRLLRVPWTVRSSNQLILKEINSESSLEGLILKLKLQSFGHLMRRANSLEKTLMLGKIEGRRRRGRQRMSGWMASQTWWTWVWVKSRRQWRTEKPGVLLSTGSQRGRLNNNSVARESNINLFCFWRPEMGGVKVWARCFSSGAGVCSPASGNFWRLLALLACGHTAPVLLPGSRDWLLLICPQIACGFPFYKNAGIYTECPSRHSR